MKTPSNSTRTIQDSRAHLQEIWNNFTPYDFQLVDTMSRRIQLVISRKVDVTQW